MILKRAIMMACAVAALATATGVFIFALAFALFAALEPSLGPALAAAGVAGAILILALLVAVVALLGAKPKPQPLQAQKFAADSDLTSKVMELARDKPIIAAAAMVAVGLAAGMVAVRNPKLTAGMVSAFMASRAAGARKP